MSYQPHNPPDKTDCRKLSGQAYGNWYWIRRRKNAPLHEPASKGERALQILIYRYYRALHATAPPEINGRGNEVYRDEDADIKLAMRRGGSRYYYDERLIGWKQYDTTQDASYWGMWVNVADRMTFTYCEGDRVLVVCPTIETFRAELADAERCYGDPPPMAVSYGADGVKTEYYDVRPTV